MRTRTLKSVLAGSVCALALTSAAQAADGKDFNVPAGELSQALDLYIRQSGEQLIYRVADVRGMKTPGVRGELSSEEALARLLEGTSLTVRRDPSGLIAVASADMQAPQSGSAAEGSGAEGTVEALIVTAQKREEDIQDVPIAISAFTQEQLENSQIAGGPDLITQIPNFSFTKTNFSSYSIQIRGIGTQAISATTDPAVAVAFNNTPFIRNRFFEQEFYDLERLEVLRGPQGTLYGRNATAGVVNIISAKPKFTYEAKVSADLGNYDATRLEGMINIPLVEGVVALRLAGAWTKRKGFATNELTGSPIDGRDLWSTRLSLRFEPNDRLSANLIWEHFQEDDDRLRSGKQLCRKHETPTQIGGIPVSSGGSVLQDGGYITQGCLPVSLYSPEAFQTPNGFSLPYYGPIGGLGSQTFNIDPYLRGTQSRDLRVIESTVEPEYKAEVDIAELQIAFDLSDTLTLNSETAYGSDFLWSLQDYNRFTTAPGIFQPSNSDPNDTDKHNLVDENGVFCDPQLGCSDRLLLVDLSTERSTQFSQELRLASDFEGPFNFSLGANYLRHDAEAKYYVFINTLTQLAGGAQLAVPDPYPWVPGVSDNSQCLSKGQFMTPTGPGSVGDTAANPDPNISYKIPLGPCIYIDPNPIGALNDQGRNYFLSKNPYKLISYAVFGETYYQLSDNLKLTAGLRFTIDRKTAPQVPSWLLAAGVAGDYPTAKTVFQEWKEPTGRLALDWKPVLPFADETLIYASYAHGYKAGGANPPPPIVVTYGDSALNNTPQELLPDTFGPEFVDAFEVGTKNTLLDGAVTLNLTGFYYDYEGYQISEIRNRSAVNSNYDAEVWGAELEADWRVSESLRLGLKGGYNGSRLADGSKAIDLMDRAAGDPAWMVMRPFPTIPSNCIIPMYVVTAGGVLHTGDGGPQYSVCVLAYTEGYDPVTVMPYVANPTERAVRSALDPNVIERMEPLGPAYANYPGFNPATAPNGGRGIDKDLSGNELPNAPRYTATATLDYTLPLAKDWLMTLHGDYHWQSDSWARVFNSNPYDRLESFSIVNLAAIFTNEDAGWKVMAYVKNVLDETALTGAFLNSDDTGLTTNVFLTEPRLYGLRVTKDFTGGGWLGDIGRCGAGGCPVTVEIGGGVGHASGDAETYSPEWLSEYGANFPLSQAYQHDDFDWGDNRSIKLTYAPSPDWRVSAAYRFGKTKNIAKGAAYEHVDGGMQEIFDLSGCSCKYERYVASPDNHFRGAARDMEEHAIADFAIGREMDFGFFGNDGRSTFSLGLRQVRLRSTSTVATDGIPNRIVAPLLPLGGSGVWTLETYTTVLDSKREFEGAGPQAAWEASMRLFGGEEQGHVDVDWSVAGGVLFGDQTMESQEDRLANYFETGTFLIPEPPTANLFDDVIPLSRSDNTTVPNVSLSVGLSYAIDRIKVGAGYSYDRFFDAIDGGVNEARQYGRDIHGPYFKLSVGFGGG